MGNKKSSYIVSDGSCGNSDAAAALPGGSYKGLEFSISCENLRDSNVVSKMDPFVVIWLLKGTQWVELTRTEIVDNNSYPAFDSVLARFNVAEVERLKFVVYDAENATGTDLRRKKIVGSVEGTVRDILKAEMWKADLNYPGSSGSRGTILVTGEVMIESSIDIVMRMRCDDVEQYEMFSTCKPFIRISRAGGLGGPPIKVLTTSIEKGKNVKFAEVRTSFQHLANSDLNRSIKFQLYDWEGSGRHVILAETSMTLAQLQQRVMDGKGALGLPLINCRKPGKPCVTTLMFDYFQAVRVPTLYDYLRGGTDLSFATAIDFTGSNGESSSFFAFKTKDPEAKRKNAAEMYEAVVQEIGGVLMTYDTDGRFPAFGFQGEFCFPLNGIESNPSVEGITGMISSFRQALANVKLKGNTHFEPVIQRAAQLASLPPAAGVLRQYIVMIILTDGKFTDQKKIVEAMATVSNLPISFVYVVVGDDPDGVNIKSFEELKTASRQYTNRDMIQIIQMNTLNDLSVNARSFTIARQMIKELPTQVVTYYAGLDIQPENAAVKFGNVSLFGM